VPEASENPIRFWKIAAELSVKPKSLSEFAVEVSEVANSLSEKPMEFSEDLKRFWEIVSGKSEDTNFHYKKSSCSKKKVALMWNIAGKSIIIVVVGVEK